MAEQTVYTRATNYEVSVFPPDDPHYYKFLILVDPLADGRWWVRRSGHSTRLGSDGTWGRDGDGPPARLKLDEALAAAQAQAPLITCGGMVPTEFVAWAEQQIAGAGRG